MVTITKNRLRNTYERTAREMDAAQAAYDAIVAEHAGLFQHMADVEEWLHEAEQREDLTLEEHDEVNDAWYNASEAINAVSGDAWNILAGTKELAHHAYAAYIA